MTKTSKTFQRNPSKYLARYTSSENVEPALMELFIGEIKDIFWAEKYLVKKLPLMKKAAGSEKLTNAISYHLEATKGHVRRLEEVFGLLGKKVKGKKCEAMIGLIKEGEAIIEDTKKGSATRDTGIILAVQKIEHYEMATYGGLTQIAKNLGVEKISELLGYTLNEEREADAVLTRITENNDHTNVVELAQ